MKFAHQQFQTEQTTMSESLLLSPPTDVRFSVAQQAIVRLEKIRVQGTFVAVNVLLLLVVAYTTHRFPHKFVRVTGEYVFSCSLTRFSFSSFPRSLARPTRQSALTHTLSHTHVCASYQ